MKNYKALIIDDEENIQQLIKIKLAKYCPQIQVAAFADNAKDAFALIQQHQPNMIFLDIAMPGESGFDLLDYFDTFSFEIIFVTGFSEYAIDALRLSAVDYLLKPINTKLLVQAVQRAIDRISERKDIERYKILKQNLNNAGSQNSKIAIPGLDHYKFIEVANIIRCEGWDSYTKIHLLSGEVLVSTQTIGMIKDMLLNFNFHCTHKSHIINTNQIASYHKEGTLKMSDGSEVPVSRRKKRNFVDQFIKNTAKGEIT